MSDIINDIIENIEIKPNKNKLYLKWVVRIAVALIGVAFVLGQFKVTVVNKINGIENEVNLNKIKIMENGIMDEKRHLWVEDKFRQHEAQNEKKFEYFQSRLDKQ